MKRDILIRPFVTEKMSQQMEAGHYAFVVDRNANKVEIRKAIEQRYPDVQVKEVRTIVVRGKRKRQMTRRGVLEGRRASYKKAVVTLKEGSEQIDFFENI